MASASATIPRPTGQPRRRRTGQQVVRLQTPGGRSPSPFIATPTVQTQSRSQKRLICPRSDCRSTDIVEEGGDWICGTCGTIIRDGNPFVSDQQWTETAAGASQPQGTYVGQDQTHSRTALHLPGKGHLLGELGATEGAKTRTEARAALQRLGNFFTIPESIQGPAYAVFSLALMHNFLSGRTMESVCAVCFYVACRRVRDPESAASSIMLIDIAEYLNMNVFLLGSTYTKLVDKIQLRNKHNPDERVEAMPPETLVARFAKELDFGRDTNTIKRDAVNIVRRMNRDWMTTGRRQAGVVGAAIILAAKMNNYRRTVREVVLVAKVTEITINKRLEEFQYTESSDLTVEAFKDSTIRDGLQETDPPSYYRARGLGPEKKRKRKRGRPKKNLAPETAAELEDEDADDTTHEAAKRVRLDAQGFKIPPLPLRSPPIDPQLEREFATIAEETEQELGQTRGSNVTDTFSDPGDTVRDSQPLAAKPTAASSRPRRHGRPPGRKNWQPPPPSPAEIARETIIERDIRYVLEQNDAPPGDFTATGPAPSEATSDGTYSYPPIPETDDSATDPSASVVSAWESTPEATRPAVNTDIGNTGMISLSPILGPTEFDDDPEVSVCMLTPIESAIKERIWVDENAEWLRKDSLKRVKKELKDKERREKGGGDEVEKKSGRRKKAGRIGDVSYLDRPESGEEEEGGSGVVGANGERRRERSMEESVRRMMAVRAPALSRRINYGVLNNLFGDESGSQGDSGSRSGSRSRSASVASTAGTDVSGPVVRSKMSLAAEKREAAKKQARLKAKNEAAARSQASEEAGSSSSTSSTPPAESSSTSAAPVSTTTPTLVGSTDAVAVTSNSSTGSEVNRRQRRQALARSPSPAPPTNSLAASQIEDEVLGSVDESELSSLTSSRNSPMLGASLHGFGEGTGEADEEESSGDEDDYVDDDIEAALEGRNSRRRRDLRPSDDENEDDA